jgi:hypothetical protein
MRNSKRLSAMRVAHATKPGRYADGAGLYLQVSQSETRTRQSRAGRASVSRPPTRAWIFRFMRNGVPRHMGLGSARDVTLSEARDLAAECRKQLRSGADPIVERQAKRSHHRAANPDLQRQYDPRDRRDIAPNIGGRPSQSGN